MTERQRLQVVIPRSKCIRRRSSRTASRSARARSFMRMPSSSVTRNWVTTWWCIPLPSSAGIRRICVSIPLGVADYAASTRAHHGDRRCRPLRAARRCSLCWAVAWCAAHRDGGLARSGEADFRVPKARTHQVDGILGALCETDAAVICFAPGFAADQLQRFARSCVTFAVRPVDLGRLAPEANLCVSYGAEGTMIHFLRAGAKGAQLGAPEFLRGPGSAIARLPYDATNWFVREWGRSKCFLQLFRQFHRSPCGPVRSYEPD